MDIWGWVAGHTDKLFAGILGGIIGAGLKESFQYVWGWYRAGRHESADFHIAATMYPRIDLQDPGHQAYWPALEAGKTHVQELIWLGTEVPLDSFLSNPYVLRRVNIAMSNARGPGLLLGALPERAERPLIKKILGFHNSIPANDIVRVYKAHVGTDRVGRCHGISPPTHEHYDGSPHRRVLRAMFIADSQLSQGLPPKAQVHFPNKAQSVRYDTLQSLIEDYKETPDRFSVCRAYF